MFRKMRELSQQNVPIANTLRAGSLIVCALETHENILRDLRLKRFEELGDEMKLRILKKKLTIFVTV